jgi:hypothetical protein
MNDVIMQAYRETVEREQESRRENAKKQREKAAQRRKNAARTAYIGQLIVEYFPEVTKFQLQRTKEANEVEFMPLTRFLTMLAADTDYVAGVKEKVIQELSDAKAGQFIHISVGVWHQTPPNF